MMRAVARVLAQAGPVAMLWGTTYIADLALAALAMGQCGTFGRCVVLASDASDILSLPHEY